MVCDIIHKFAVLEKQKNNLEVEKTGSFIPKNIKKFLVCFRCYEKMTQDQSRILVMTCVNDILDLINDDLEIRPYLQDYPCTAYNIELLFVFADQNNKCAEPPFIALIFAGDGIIYYACYDYAQECFCDDKIETWEEAVRLSAP